jgi:hypothetical protein
MFWTTIAQRPGRSFTQISLCAVLAAVVQLFTVICFAQSTFGGFVGTVRDPSGAVVGGCTVTVTNLGTSAARTATTDGTGSYTVVNLDPGTYEITIEISGFQKATYTNLQLLSRQTLRVDGSIVIASQAQTFEVHVEAISPISTEVSNIAETKSKAHHPKPSNSQAVLHQTLPLNPNQSRENGSEV